MIAEVSRHILHTKKKKENLQVPRQRVYVLHTRTYIGTNPTDDDRVRT